jgi:formate dehydrogenase major subunit
VEARALVAGRMQPLVVEGRVIHQIGMPWHFGWGGIATGDIANDLTALIQDPNSRIHEGMAFTCDFRKGRKRLTLAREEGET